MTASRLFLTFFSGSYKITDRLFFTGVINYNRQQLNIQHREVNKINGGVLIYGLIFLLLGIGSGYLIRKFIAEARITSAEEEAERIIEEARKQGEAKKREKILESKEEAHEIRNELEQECRQRRNELQKFEDRLLRKEENIDNRAETLEDKETQLKKREDSLNKKEEQLSQLHKEERARLEKISGMTSEEAREELMSRIEEEIEHEKAMMVKEMETKAREEADKKAGEIIATAIQRCAADHVAETTVSVVSLPSDEMKGRIIGREGRNIRTFETLTGVDLIIDDTPEAVVISGFDPIRREIARVALEKLITDGRIHPGRIEEMVAKAEKEIDSKIKEDGEQATFDTDVHGLHSELVTLLGRLKYRTSYGQNVLLHSIEVAHLAGIMAAELGRDTRTAKRAGLLHDIGKAVDHEVEGPHVVIGADLVKKFGESDLTINAVAAHHGDGEAESVEAVLIQAADAVSAARPGARRETLEAYIKRLEELEQIANSFSGVDKAYAIQAGRELRIMVQPEEVNDTLATNLARDIVKKIEKDLEYPGQIKVNVIREIRAVEYAK